MLTHPVANGATPFAANSWAAFPLLDSKSGQHFALLEALPHLLLVAIGWIRWWPSFAADVVAALRRIPLSISALLGSRMRRRPRRRACSVAAPPSPGARPVDQPLLLPPPLVLGLYADRPVTRSGFGAKGRPLPAARPPTRSATVPAGWPAPRAHPRSSAIGWRRREADEKILNV
jgi:hypothetical protein